MTAQRELDIVLYGATGFVGRLTAEYLARSAPAGVRIGMAGRSRERLDEVRATLGTAAAQWPLHVADSSDPASLRAIAEAARVLVTTVGPYQRHGLPVVEACAAAGTHYADLSGEVLFMRESIDRCDAAAQVSGARIVHTCGFDSIPSDLGVFLLHAAAQGDGAGDLEDTTLVVRAMKGAASGGTLASMKATVDEARASKDARRRLVDPYALSPDRSAEPEGRGERDPRGIEHDPELGGWLAPFVMGQINTRVVRRSNALLGWDYGRSLRYRELMRAGEGVTGRAKAAAIAGGIGALTAGLAFKPTRAVLDRVLPAPGEGPGEQARRSGFFKIELRTRTSSGARYRCRVEAQGDPGYQATAVMLGESALCLLVDEERLPPRAGVLTPATAMGMALVERLRAAGQTLAVDRLD